jgi:DNA mismatch repair protein MutL
MIAREQAPRGRGTTVTARDLFHAIPARRALLRGPRSEATRVAAITRAYALAHPAVRFTLIDDGALLLQTPGTDLTSAVAAIFGGDMARSLLKLTLPEAALPDAHVSGAVTARALNFPTREHIYLSVNGRPLVNRALLSALEAGYRPTLRKGRHPLLVIQVSVAPERIDANIHPAKLDALLRDEAAIAAGLRKLTHETLGSAPIDLTLATTAPAMLATSSIAPLRMTFPATRRRRGLRLREQPHVYTASLGALQWDETPTTTLPLLAPLAQFDNALIVAQSEEGHLYLVDQHRAHERILYERLLAQRRTTGPGDSVAASQMLLEPLLIELTPLQARTLTARIEELAALGLELQPFGPASFLARALPSAPGAAQSAVGFAEELAREAAEESDDWLNDVCKSLACRSAIRRGQPLSEAEQRALLDDLRQTAAPAVCPHGAPLIIRQSRSSLTKLFEW